MYVCLRESAQRVTYRGDFVEKNFERRVAVFARIVAQLDDIFDLPVRGSPGARFVGAIFTPAKLGLHEHGVTPVGVGGRGMTQEEAVGSCLGEAAELISYLERPRDPLIAPFNATHLPCENHMEWALAGIGLTPDVPVSELDWTALQSINAEEYILMPFEMVVRRPTGRRVGLRPSESNGLGAHIDFQRAIQSGLLEVIERDAIAIWWHGGAAARRISNTEFEEIGLETIAQQVGRGNERGWWVLDITSDLGIPVAACLSSNADGQMVVAGFGAGLEFKMAVRSAFLEMCQMEFAQENAVARCRERAPEDLKKIDLDWLDRYQNLNVIQFPQLSGSASSLNDRSRLQFGSIADVCRHLEESNYGIFWSNLTRAEVALPVVRVIIPGLQSAHVDWQTERLKSQAKQNSKDLKISATQPAPI